MSALKSRKIAITGSTGLVGSHLVAELLRSGASHITLLVRNSGRLEQLHKTLEREGVKWSQSSFIVLECALNNPLEMGEAFMGIDLVFHCAATVSIGGAGDDTLIQTNVEMTQHVVNAAIKCGVRRLVHVSSIATLNTPLEWAQYADETSTMETLAGTSAYAASKFFCENEITRGSTEGLECITVNPGPIIGTGDWRGGSAAIIPILSRGLRFYTEGAVAYVDVRNVVRAMVLLSDCDKAVGEKFVLTSENLSYRELISISNTIVGARPPSIKIGRTLASIAWRGAYVASLFTRRAPLLTRDMARILIAKSYYKGDKVKKYITFEYTPITQTLERVIGDYKSEKEWLKLQ